MNAAPVAFAFWLLAAAPLAAAEESICGIPPSLVETFAPLPHTGKAVKRGGKLDVLVLSAAPSQTGPAKNLKTYPAALEASLRARLGETAVNVVAFAVPRKTIDGFAAALPKVLKQQKPNLVIWQTGTIEAMRGIDPDVYGEKLQRAVSKIQASGADAILVNPQFGPRIGLMFDAGPYIDNIRWVSQTTDAPYFNRYAIMKYWGDNDIFDLAAARSDGTYEKLHKCLGRLLADFIIRAGSLPGNQER
jgi:lysophospholipase L1-like esterase